MLCPHGPVPAGTTESIVYPLLSRPEVEELQDLLREHEHPGARTGHVLRQLIATLLAAWDANESVSRFAREVDLSRFDFVEGTFTYTEGYMNGYSAARGELRALLGIEGE